MAASAAYFFPFLLLLPAAVFLGLLSPSCAADNILYSGQRLDPGQYVSYGKYKLIMQEDCDCVLYDNGHSIWATDTYKKASYCYLIMQSDANLVLYSREGKRLWESNSAKFFTDHYVLVLQRDRNLVIYGGAVWATGTNSEGTGVTVDRSPAAAMNETSSSGPVAVVVNTNAGGELDLGRKISMVTTKGNE